MNSLLSIMVHNYLNYSIPEYLIRKPELITVVEDILIGVPSEPLFYFFSEKKVSRNFDRANKDIILISWDWTSKWSLLNLTDISIFYENEMYFCFPANQIGEQISSDTSSLTI